MRCPDCSRFLKRTDDNKLHCSHCSFTYDISTNKYPICKLPTCENPVIALGRDNKKYCCSQCNSRYNSFRVTITAGREMLGKKSLDKEYVKNYNEIKKEINDKLLKKSTKEIY